REAPRSLYSLSAAYQRHIEPRDYEVIVVDNGSDPPFDRDIIKRLSGNFRVIRLDRAPRSPAHAVNVGLAAARGQVIGVMIDGARIVTPCLLHFGVHGVRLYERAIVTPLGWYLGYDYQPWSMLSGHDQAYEDGLLAASKWQEDGYALFDIATMDGPSEDGWFAPLNESSALFLSRETWDQLAGMDERFDLPGGGLVNLDTFCRALELPDAQLVVLLGEGTFHQAHGGAASGVPAPRFDQTAEAWFKQYETLRGRAAPQPRPDVPRTYLGVLPRPVLARFVRSVVKPLPRQPEAPLGVNFDYEHWAPASLPTPVDQGVAEAIELAYRELNAGRGSTAVAIARLVRMRAPHEPAVERLLSTNAGWQRYDEVIGPLAEHHVALAEAHRHLGDDEGAAVHYREASRHDNNLTRAHTGLAGLRTEPADRPYVFIHIQRTGGNAIRSALALAEKDPHKHFSARELRCIHGEAKWSDCFKFAFVRNPWDRLVSWWSLIDNGRDSPGMAPAPNNFFGYVLSQANSFEEFLFKCTNEIVDADGRKHIFRNQIDYLADENGELIVDFVGRFERLQEDFDSVTAELGLPRIILPEVNVSHHATYTEYYTPATAEMVRQKYSRDIEIFGYEFGK
ncbi:MAG TPA: sulfotransferase family 2 domain-containing protein, partial [Stellaceae bacterium]|nr:sulfotransferase family 2 domain-containing protein [Stellaceae bacterium]